MSLEAAPFSLAAVSAGDDYTDAAQVEDAPPGRYVFVQVVNAAVYYRVQRDGNWEPFETFLGPWVGTLDRGSNVTGIAFRNAAAGVVAVVSASVQDSADNGSIPGYTIDSGGGVTPAAGTDVSGDIVWSAVASRDGSVLCDGAHHDSIADKTLATLYGLIGTAFGGTGPSDFAVPDLLDRVMVGAGRNTALAANEGVSGTNRHATRHRQTVTDPGHAHGVTYPGGALAHYFTSGSLQYAPQNPGAVDTHYDGSGSVAISSGATGISVGASATDPLDGPAYLGLYPFIVK